MKLPASLFSCSKQRDTRTVDSTEATVVLRVSLKLTAVAVGDVAKGNRQPSRLPAALPRGSFKYREHAFANQDLSDLSMVLPSAVHASGVNPLPPTGGFLP